MQSATALFSGNLPAEPNSFIGRERDLAELARMLGEVRALTLSGPRRHRENAARDPART